MLRKLKNICIEIIMKNNYKKYHKKYYSKEYILFGTPTHSNIGDHAITYAEKKMLNDVGVYNIFEVPSFKRYGIIDYISKKINENGIIMINGGGFMGSQWLGEEEMIRDVIEHFPNNKIIIFPQTAFYKDDENGQSELQKSFEIYNKHKNLVLCAREKKTYEFFKEKYTHAKILFTPDIVLYLEKMDYSQNRNGLLLCMRHDPEKKVTSTDEQIIYDISSKYFSTIRFTDTIAEKNISIKNRNKFIQNKLKEFAESKMIITDRLHGMIFAYLTNTPCIVFGNYNYKVKGVFYWIKNSQKLVFIENVNDLEKEIKNLLKIDIHSIDDTFVNKNLFNDLKKEILNYTRRENG